MRPVIRRREGKIERWHLTLKNRILLEHAYLPSELEGRIEAFVDHDNHNRAHESLGNLTPADVYLGRGEDILRERARDGASVRPSPIAACANTRRPPNLSPRWTQSLRS